MIHNQEELRAKLTAHSDTQNKTEGEGVAMDSTPMTPTDMREKLAQHKVEEAKRKAEGEAISAPLKRRMAQGINKLAQTSAEIETFFEGLDRKMYMQDKAKLSNKPKNGVESAIAAMPISTDAEVQKKWENIKDEHEFQGWRQERDERAFVQRMNALGKDVAADSEALYAYIGGGSPAWAGDARGNMALEDVYQMANMVAPKTTMLGPMTSEKDKYPTRYDTTMMTKALEEGLEPAPINLAAYDDEYRKMGAEAFYEKKFGEDAWTAAEILTQRYMGDNDVIDINGETYKRDELKSYLYSQIAGEQHKLLLDRDPRYMHYLVEKETGKSYGDRVDELKGIIKELRDAAGDEAASSTAESTSMGSGGGAARIYVDRKSTSREAAEKPYDDLLERIEAWEENDFASNFAEAFDWSSALSFGTIDLINSANLNRVLKQAERGEKLYGNDARLLELAMITQELEGVRDIIYDAPSTAAKWGQGLGTTAAVMPQFGLGMGLTGGIMSGVKYGAKYALKRFMVNKTIANAGRLALQGGKDLLKWSGVNYVRGMAGAPMMPMFYKGVLDGYNSQYSFNDNGDIKYTPKDKATIWVGSYIDAVNEITSEHFGAGFGDVVGLGLKGAGRVLGINKVANKTVAGAVTRKVLQAPMKESTKKFLKNLGFSGSFTGEWTGEMFGDLMSQWQRYMVGAEYDFEHFKDFDTWLTTIGVSAIMGGAMTTLGGGMTIYQESKAVKDIAKNRERIINGKIQDAALRDKLRMLSEADDPIMAASELATFFKTHNIENASDKAYALDYVMLNSQLKVLMGDVQEQERMAKFEVKRAEVEGKAYKGADGKTTNSMYTATDAEGNTYYVLSGDMANKEAMLELQDANTGEITTKVTSALTIGKPVSVDAVLVEEYGSMFDLEMERERVESATNALSSVENPTMEHIETTAAQLDITLPKKGDVVTMVDGRTAEITEDLGDGTYIAQRKESLTGESETITLPFDAIRSNDSLTAMAQEAILKSSVEATAEVADTPQPTAEVQTPNESVAETPSTVETSGDYKVGEVVVTPNGEQARVVEVNDDGTATIDYNMSGSASMADAAIEVVPVDTLRRPNDASANTPIPPQAEIPTPAVPQSMAEQVPTTEEVDAAQNVEQVPTNGDGTVNFDAINDAQTFARLYEREAGTRDTAINDVREMRAAAEEQLAKSVEKGKKLSSANEKTANRNERKALTERIAFYDAVLDILTHKSAEPASAAEETDVAEPQTEVETTTETTSFTPGLVEDEYTAKLSKKRRKALHDVAVALGLRVRFVDAVRTAAGGLANADISGNEVRIAWSKRDKAISFLVGHEFTHRMQELSPKEYASFKESVKAYMGDERWNALVAKTRSIYEAHNAREKARAEAEHRAPRLLQYSVELIEDEVVADFAGELNEDANALAAFAEKLAEKPSTLKAVIAVLRDILNKLKGLVTGAEAQRLANMLSKFEELYRASASRTTEGQTQSKEKYSLSTIKELKASLDLYNDTSNIDNFVSTVKDIAFGVGGNEHLKNIVLDYEEAADEALFAEQIGNIVGDFNGSLAPYTAGGKLFSLPSQVADILNDYDTEGAEYGSILDVADGIEALIVASAEDTTELENILNDFRAAQDDARRWGNRMDSGGEEEFEEALRAYVNKATLGERSDADSHNSSSEGLPLESSERLSGNALTSPKDVAKIGKNTEVTHRSAKNIINEGGLKKEIKTPAQAVSALGKGLHMEKSDSSQSYYGDFFEGDYIVDGNVVHLRISTHPATPVRMGNAEADHKVSIVIRKNGEHKSDGTPHSGYTEYVYEPSEVTPQDAANAVVKGVKSLLETGEFVDETGKAVRRDYPYTDTRGRTMYSLITPEMDATYLDAVERGDMETAQQMVMEAANRAGYLSDTSYQGSLAFNGAAPVENDYFGTKEQRKEAWDNGDYEGTMSLGDYADSSIDTHDLKWQLTDRGNYRRAENYTKESIDNINNALKSDNHKITIYRAVPNNVEEGAVRNGDWVTPSRKYAEYHIGLQDWEGGRIIEQEVDIDHLWWNGDDINEWGYDDGSNYGYRNTPNNRKLLDPVTYDDNGDVIPLSERFNFEKEDIRYSLIDPTTDRFNRIVALTKQLASDFNIPCPIFISDTKAEYAEMVKDCLGITPKDVENNAGFYSEEDELIGVNSAILVTRGDLRETLLHEYAHHISLKHLTAKIADIVKVIGEDNIREANKELLGEVYKYKSAEATINEFISFLVEKLTIAKTYAIFAEEMNVDDYISELKDYIASDEEITHKDVLIKVLPLVKDNIELQREQYGKERTSTIVIPRRATQALVSSPQEGSAQTYGNKEGGNRPIEAGSRVQEIDRRGEGTDAQRVNYSLSDMPFYDEQGNVIDMSTISEAKALEMIDGRVRDMIAYDYDKSVVAIAKYAKDARRTTRAYYAEERRKRRGKNDAPRTNAAKIDELFADTDINSLPLEIQALIFIAEGRAKIRWADKDGKRGLASELGLANSASDKAAMKSIWTDATQSFNEVVHGWWESINGYERGIDIQDLRNALIEAISAYPSAKAAMKELQWQYDAIAKAEREALEEIDRREAAGLERAKREYEEKSVRFEMSEGEERDALREMAVEHYSSQPMSAADEALEELTGKLNKAERRAERLMLERKGGYRELAEGVQKSKEIIIRTLENLRMFSGMEQIHIDEVAKLINMTRSARSKRQVEAVATKAKNLIQRIAIRKARENMRRLLDLKLSNVDVIQQILKESNTLPREEREALLKSLWKVSRNGWRATKAVHPDTKEIFKELNDLVKEYKKSVKDKERATIKEAITKRLAEVEAELHPDVEVDINGNVIDNAGLPVDFNDNNKNIALLLFKSYLEVEAKNIAYSEANSTLRETDKGSEKFGEALSDMYAAREDYLSALKMFNATLEDVIVNGKDKLRDFNIEKEKHEIALRSMAINAIGGEKASSQGKKANAWQWVKAGVNITFNSPYWTFETVLERIDRLSPYKRGKFYTYFMSKYTDANAKLYTAYAAHMERIGNAMARCFPDMKKQFGIIGRNPYEIYKAVMRKAEGTALGTLNYKDKGVEREMTLTVANAMYIVAMWRQPRYREAMEANGITQEAINNLMQSINKEHAGYINFMNWVNEALLPDTRLEYDEVYRKLNGGSMAKEENYFPARVVAHEEVKLDENGKGQLPTSPTALKERISHKQMPKMGTDYFKVLEAHIQDMDKWAAFAELTADLNVILSSDEFRRRLNEFMPGLGGDGGGKGSLYKMLYDTALIATGNYHNSGENVFGAIQKGWATSNIAFRLWTAVKQISSVSVGITEHKYFVKHMGVATTGVGIAYEWKQAMAISPSLRYRWQSKAAGMEALMRETARGDGYAQYRGGVVKTYDALKDIADKAVKFGMTPNALVDAIACSILVNSVYDKAIHDVTKGEREATEEERKEAIRKAEIAFNSTQQSSEGAYLSAVQANPLYAPLTTYMNASFALHRKRMSGIHELWKLMTSKEYRRFLNDEYGVDAANISAKDAFADIIRGIVGDLSFAAMGWGLMEVMSAVYEWLGGDGDDDDTEAEKEAFFETWWMPALNGLLGGGVVTSIFQGFDTSFTPAYDEALADVKGLFDDKGDWRTEVAQVITKYGLGIDIKSLYRIGAGLENMVSEETGENAGSILMFLNAPNKYIKAFVGDRREGETLQQYQTRIMRLYTLFYNVMYEELYDENGKCIGEGAPSMIMSQTQAEALNKEYEAAFLKDVVVRNGSWDEYKAMLNSEKLYKDICEFIGVTSDKEPNWYKIDEKYYPNGEFVSPVYGLSAEEHDDLLFMEYDISYAHQDRTLWVGDEEEYYNLVKEEYRLKNELIDKYNEYIK